MVKAVADGRNAEQVKTTSVGWMMKALSTRLDAEMTKELKKLDLNISQFAVLMTLLQEEGLTQAGIGKRIAMPGYATTRNIDVLEDKSLLERHPDAQSRRNYRIFLTEQGRRMAPRLFATVDEVNKQLLSTIEPDEAEQLRTILSKMVAAYWKPTV